MRFINFSTNCTFLDIPGVRGPFSGTLILGDPIDPISGSGVTSCSVADFLKIASKADRIRFSVPVIVVYGVGIGLVAANGLQPLSVNECVFFKIDFVGCVPKCGRNLEFSFLRACGVRVSLLAICRNVKISGAGTTSNLDGLR